MNEMTNSGNDNGLGAASRYALAGLRVLPVHAHAEGRCTCDDHNCSSPAKHPLLAKGVRGASNDLKVISSWWKEAPEANVGIATGYGIVVLDIDPKHGGMATLAQWESVYGVIPRTPTVITGSEGRHYYFKEPANESIGNRTHIGPGVDVRGTNGYVVAPPSLHASGKRYEWLIPVTEPMAPVPPWLLELLRRPSQAPQQAQAASNGLVLRVADHLYDLSSDPGATEGTRHDTLCRLTGKHLAAGDSLDRVLHLAYAWGDRCKPPMGELEIEQVVTGLSRKHLATVERDRIAAEEMAVMDPLPEPPKWPCLQQDAYYGVLGEIVKAVEPQTEADPAAVLYTALTLFGNVVGRSPYFMVEGAKHHTNLFCALVGDSSRGRKGTSLSRTQSLFGSADPNWLRDCVSSGLSSGEGLIHAVRDAVTEMQVVNKKDEPPAQQVYVKDPGVEDKRLLVVESEFAQTLKVMRREGNTLSPVIRQAWDSGRLQVLTKVTASRATDAHIAILSHITREELVTQMGSTDYLNGFANRFLWVRVRRSKLLPDGGALLDVTSFERQLATAVRSARRINKMSRSPKSRDLWYSVYPELTAEVPGRLGAVVGRGEAQTLRLSMIYALIDGSSVIEEPHLRAALAAWRYSVESAQGIFGTGEQANPLDVRILTAIKAQPGINRRGLYKATSNNVAAADLLAALARLRDSGLAHSVQVDPRSRTGEQWYPYAATPTPPPLEPVTPSPAVPASVSALPAVPAACSCTDDEILTDEEFFAELRDI